MAAPSITVRINEGEARALLLKVVEECALRAATKAVTRTKSNITSSGRMRTGAMRDGVHSVKTTSGIVTTYTISSTAAYTGFQEFGIGPVHARPGGTLRFMPKGSNVFIFRSRTAGFAGAHFFRDAITAMTISDFLP